MKTPDMYDKQNQERKMESEKQFTDELVTLIDSALEKSYVRKSTVKVPLPENKSLTEYQLVLLRARLAPLWCVEQTYSSGEHYVCVYAEDEKERRIGYDLTMNEAMRGR